MGITCGAGMNIVGTFELVIDSKNRLSIPRAVRASMDADEGQGFYFTPGDVPRTLAVYPEKLFKEMLAEQALPAERMRGALAEWRRFQCSQSVLLVPDDQGRVVIPKYLLDRAGLRPGDAAMIGLQDHLELWDRAAYAEYQDQAWRTYLETKQNAMELLRKERASNGHAPQP